MTLQSVLYKIVVGQAGRIHHIPLDRVCYIGYDHRLYATYLSFMSFLNRRVLWGLPAQPGALPREGHAQCLV